MPPGGTLGTPTPRNPRGHTGGYGCFPGFEALDWNGVFVRHGTPETVVHKLNAGLNKALAAPQVSARYTQLNIQSHENGADDFYAFVRNQMTYWGGVVKDLNIKVG